MLAHLSSPTCGLWINQWLLVPATKLVIPPTSSLHHHVDQATFYLLPSSWCLLLPLPPPPTPTSYYFVKNPISYQPLLTIKLSTDQCQIIMKHSITHHHQYQCYQSWLLRPPTPYNAYLNLFNIKYQPWSSASAIHQQPLVVFLMPSSFCWFSSQGCPKSNGSLVPWCFYWSWSWSWYGYYVRKWIVWIRMILLKGSRGVSSILHHHSRVQEVSYLQLSCLPSTYQTLSTSPINHQESRTW